MQQLVLHRLWIYYLVACYARAISVGSVGKISPKCHGRQNNQQEKYLLKYYILIPTPKSPSKTNLIIHNLLLHGLIEYQVIHTFWFSRYVRSKFYVCCICKWKKKINVAMEKWKRERKLGGEKSFIRGIF